MDSDEYDYAVATLGDGQGTTCSYRAARVRFPSGGIARVASFERAVEMVRDGLAAHALVPAAYPAICRFYFDPSLECAGTFQALLPPFVVASCEGLHWRRPHQAYVHSAPRALLPAAKSHATIAEVVECSSNSEAARQAAEQNQLAITNSWSADVNGLTKQVILLMDVRMDWMLFRRRSKCQEVA